MSEEIELAAGHSPWRERRRSTSAKYTGKRVLSRDNTCVPRKSKFRLARAAT